MTRCALLALLLARSAAADTQCRVVDVEFTTADDSGNTNAPYHFRPQVVVWLQDSTGAYVDTLYITAETGAFGLGNRPGRFDFNSGPLWPYGRRTTTFPVWASLAKPELAATGTYPFPTLEFQDKNDNDLSHLSKLSSTELHYCRPLDPHPTDGDLGNWDAAFDAGTCATPPFTDKGEMSATLGTTGYPPRIDITRNAQDSMDVDLYPMMNPFDAVSQATPAEGTPSEVIWPIPKTLAPGDYTVMVEVSKEFDYNATYNDASYPPPDVSYAQYGAPYRGQPSVIYQVPFTIGATQSVGSTTAYAGYGDPDGMDGAIRASDTTISTEIPGSGGARLALVADPGGMYRVRVTSLSEVSSGPPPMPDEAMTTSVTTTAASLSFVSPGIDGDVGRVHGYEIRYLAQTPITDANFATGTSIDPPSPDDPGQIQTFDIAGLLPETDYYVGIRAFDDCKNPGVLAVVAFTTPARPVGEVDACFVATAAYGSLMANDVGMLRRFRDAVLRNNVFGELFVETYYTFGPAVAGVVAPSDLVRTTARAWLAPLVRFAGAAKL